VRLQRFGIAATSRRDTEGEDLVLTPTTRLDESHKAAYRENGSDVAFWFRFTPKNLAALTRTIARKLIR